MSLPKLPANLGLSALNVFDALFINGSWCAPAQGKTFDVVNPATEEIIYKSPAATAEDVAKAVESAKAAFESGVWSRSASSTRAAVLTKMGAIIRQHREALGNVESLNGGKPLAEALCDIDDTASCFEYYAGLAPTMDEIKKVDIGDAKFDCAVVKEPKGVCAAIVPWNYPALMAAWKIAPALASGCSLILKPSEFTPITAMALAAVAQEAGLPNGVLNVVTGTGAVAGAALSSRDDLDKIAFTGSVVTGSTIMAAASKNVTPITLELGGKSPIIVFDDADLDRTIEWIMIGIFFNSGQVCSATSRLLVQEGIASRLLPRLAAEANSLVIGSGLSAGVQLGPLVNRLQYDRVMSYIADGKAAGANVLCGGGRAPGQDKGFFVAPTIFTNVKSDMKIWREEIFGPVLCVQTFVDEAQALREANDTCYGLGAAVMSEDIARCRRVSRRINSGIVWENCSQPTFVQLPWGGQKRSGIGRELGPWGLENFTSVKQIVRYASNDLYGWYPQKSK